MPRPPGRTTTTAARRRRPINEKMAAVAAAGVAKRSGKYNAKGQYIDGQWFPSQAEAARYGQLKALEQAGKIEGLTLQPAFALVVNGHHITNYRGDFGYVVLDSIGRPVRRQYEDVKGMVTDEYVLKSRLTKALFSIELFEIPSKEIEQWANRIPEPSRTASNA